MDEIKRELGKKFGCRGTTNIIASYLSNQVYKTDDICAGCFKPLGKSKDQFPYFTIMVWPKCKTDDQTVNNKMIDDTVDQKTVDENSDQDQLFIDHKHPENSICFHLLDLRGNQRPVYHKDCFKTILVKLYHMTDARSCSQSRTYEQFFM
jgi:hypothetical protein